jgi:hypothetical protein
MHRPASAATRALREVAGTTPRRLCRLSSRRAALGDMSGARHNGGSTSGGGGGGGGGSSSSNATTAAGKHDVRGASGPSLDRAAICGAAACAAAGARLRALEDALMCAICHAPAAAPVALHGCGHLFCSYCVRAVLGTRSRCPEPHCGAPATTASITPLRRLDAARGDDAPSFGGGGGEKLEGAGLGANDRAGDAGNVRPAGNPLRSPAYLVHLTSVTASRDLLRRQLAKAGLSDAGSVEELLARHREYVLRFNANLDAAAPRPEAAVAAEVRQWERAIAAERARAERRGKSASWWDSQKQPAAKRQRAALLSGDAGAAGVGARSNGELGGDGGDAQHGATVVLPGDTFDEIIRKTRARSQRPPPIPAPSGGRDVTGVVRVLTGEQLQSDEMTAHPVPGPHPMVTPESVAIAVLDPDNFEEVPVPTPPRSPVLDGKTSHASDDDCVIVAEHLSQELIRRDGQRLERAPSTPIPSLESGSPLLTSNKDSLRRGVASGITRHDSEADEPAEDSRVLSSSEDCTLVSPTIGKISQHKGLKQSSADALSPMFRKDAGEGFEVDCRRNEIEAELSSPEKFTPWKKRLRFDNSPQTLAASRTDVACSSVDFSESLFPVTNDSTSVPSNHAASLNTVLSSDQCGIMNTAKNEVGPGNETMPRDELTPELRERIERNRLRAIALQRRKKGGNVNDGNGG